VKSQKINSCVYGPDGKALKAVTLAPPEKKKQRGLEGRIVEKKVGERADDKERVQNLVIGCLPSFETT
jgi:hypothetical protein